MRCWKRRGCAPYSSPLAPREVPSAQRPRERGASWSAVTEMHGASLHRRHRFRGVKDHLWPQYFVRPAGAAALSRGAERASYLPHPSACESGVAPRLAARTPRRSALAQALGFLPRAIACLRNKDWIYSSQSGVILRHKPRCFASWKTEVRTGNFKSTRYHFEITLKP